MKQIGMSLVLVVVILAGGWALLNRDQINSLDDAINLVRRQLDEATRKNSPYQIASSPRIIPLEEECIRIASFNIQTFGVQKSKDAATMQYLARIVREFDVVAIQEIRAEDQSFLRRFIKQINESGRNFQYVISPRLGRSTYREQYAFIFDSTTVQLDSAQHYTVQDPDDLMQREPFVGWFRARQARPDLAFTFTLVNVHLDSKNASSEIEYLGEVFLAVRNDGRLEDDILIAGDFNSDENGFAQLETNLGLRRAIVGQNTNTRSSQHYDNLLFDPTATKELNGRAGVFDFMRIFNLTLVEALKISDHLPIWAEFSIYEGGVANRTARFVNSVESNK